MSRVRNFCAGPCTLPAEVLDEVSDELSDFEGSGMSLIEMSHRSPEYVAVHEDALDRLRRVLEVPDDFEVLFLQGGGLLQFAMVPMNLVPSGSTAGYVRSGAWGKAAHADATRAVSAYLAWDGQDSGFARMPEPQEIEVRSDARYVHVTSNETIEGIQLRELPDLGVPLVVDVSSDFLTRSVEWERVDLLYGGVQKNLGPAGLAVVVIRRSALDACAADLPSYLSFPSHAKAGSLLNTPPMFSVYVTGKMLRWIEDRGGLAGHGGAGGATFRPHLRRDRGEQRLLHLASGAASQVANECRLPVGRPRPRRSLPRRDAGRGAGEPQRTPQRRRHAREHLQRDAGRGGGRARRLHARFRGGRRMSRLTARGTFA